MALPQSSLSQVCRAIADFVSDGLSASANSIRVMIGNPAEAVPGQADTEHRVNLFFYRFEPSNFFADSSPQDPWWIRLYCLITAFGVAEDQISPGENDLRLLGELIRLFHETPVLDPITVNDQEFQLQVIFQPLNSDDLNHIWSTQNEVSYRPSVVYEMAVAPVVPSIPHQEAPLTGAAGLEIRGDMTSIAAPFAGEIHTPLVQASKVDFSTEDWTPSICFVLDGKCSLTIAFERESQDFADFQPSVWVAGKPGSTVNLTWEKWTREQGWQPVAGAMEITVSSNEIDPSKADSAHTETIDLPSEEGSYQAVLFARRSYMRSADQKELTVRSNPLLVTIYQGS